MSSYLLEKTDKLVPQTKKLTPNFDNLQNTVDNLTTHSTDLDWIKTYTLWPWGKINNLKLRRRQ